MPIDLKTARILVAGGGGFIGGALVKRLSALGASDVQVADIKPLRDWYHVDPKLKNHVLDLGEKRSAFEATAGRTVVFNLAADMGGMGFIETHKAECMLTVLINTHLLMGAKEAGVERFFYSSSACVYNAEKQVDTNVQALKEADAYPAMPEDGYGWEKLFSERMCRHFTEDYGLATRVARYHNVYGPDGTFEGGREKAPAALCRKIAEAKLSGKHEIEIWGDGEQTRSFMYIDDCLEGTLRLTLSDITEPLNIGSSELVSINQMASIIEKIAGISVKRVYDLDAPKGVRGRNSDNTLIQEKMGWQPSIRLADGLERTYAWIYDQIVPRFK
jgi:nucleoside-diphosphate-sugar epimerase